MFADLDATLRAMLPTRPPPAAARSADVSFDTPDKDYKPSQATVNPFLYDVAENRELRDPAPPRELAGHATRHRLAAAGGLHVPGHRVVGQHGRSRPRRSTDCSAGTDWLSRFPVIDDSLLVAL